MRSGFFSAYEALFSLIIHDIVGAGIARGDLRQVDPDLAAALLMSIYLGSCALLQSDGKIWIAPDQVSASVLEGLRWRHPPPASEDGDQW